MRAFPIFLATLITWARPFSTHKWKGNHLLFVVDLCPKGIFHDIADVDGWSKEDAEGNSFETLVPDGVMEVGHILHAKKPRVGRGSRFIHDH